MMAAVQEHAEQAIHSFIGNALVFLLDGRADRESSKSLSSSGTLFRTDSGAVVVLTAKHVLEEDVPPDGFSLGGACLGERAAISDVVTTHWAHPTSDVAVALLRPNAVHAVGNAPLSVALVALPDDHAIAKDEFTVLSGYPAGYRRFAKSATTVSQYFVPVTYATDVQSLAPDGRYVVEWDLGVTDDPKGAFKFLGIKPGQEYEMPHPGGISGGGLWRVAGSMHASEIWAPAKRTRLVGIASKYVPQDKVELVPSVKIWGDWFHELAARI